MARGRGKQKGAADETRWLGVPVALALTASVVVAFVDRIRHPHEADGNGRLQPTEALQELDHPAVDAFDARAAGATGGPKQRLLRLAERRGWGWLGRALQVQQRFGELRGGELAASVTLQTFLALFPLLLCAIAVLGFLNANSADFTNKVIENLGLHGTAADNMREALATASTSRKATTVIGVLGLAWSGLGVTSALRSAYNRAWQVQDRGVRDKAFGLVWLVGASLIFVASIAATTVVRVLPGVLAPLGIVVGLAVSFVLFLWTEKVLTDVDVGWRALVPGAIVGAVGLEVLKAIGAFVVPSMVASSSALYGTLGIVFALLAWLLLLGRLVVYTAVCNVVLYEAKRGTVVSTVEVPRHAAATREATRSGLAVPDAPKAAVDA
jgi:membrane protein